MVGPLSSEEIEDVVSSVRRLVSNELHPRPLSRDLNSDRLLLTAALRVVPEASPLAPLVLDASLVEATPDPDLKAGIGDADAAEGRVVADPDLSGDEFVADDAAVAALFAVDVPPDPTEDVEPDLTPAFLRAEEETVIEMPAGLTEDAAVAEDFGAGDRPGDEEATWGDAIWIEPEPSSLGEVALGSEEAEVLTGPATDGPEADARTGSVMPDDWDQAEPAWSAADDPVPFVPLRRRAEQLSARLASGEMPSAPPAETEAAPAEATPVSVAGPATTEFVDADGMQLAVLDEAALQDIVRQTLRAELQGDLGERITRNIRKLVRAEINRAFLARDLD